MGRSGYAKQGYFFIWHECKIYKLRCSKNGFFFENSALVFSDMYKCSKKSREKISSNLAVIWPPRQTPLFLANIRKWNFSNILKTHHMIYQSTQNLMLISEMYGVIGLCWVFYILCALKDWNGPVFQYFRKRGSFQSLRAQKRCNTKKTL